MPIIRVENDEIEVACAACGAARTLAICDVLVQPSEQDASGSREARSIDPTRERSLGGILDDSRGGL